MLLRNVVDLLKVVIELAREVGPPIGVAKEHLILWEVLDKHRKDGRVYISSYSHSHIGTRTRVKDYSGSGSGKSNYRSSGSGSGSKLSRLDQAML